jgi:hypothetical protein
VYVVAMQLRIVMDSVVVLVNWMSVVYVMVMDQVVIPSVMD